MRPLQPGDQAPDFTLRDQFGQDVTMSGFRGRKSVLLMFYPFAFSGVCQGELSGVRERLDEFLTFQSEVLAVSCDAVYSQRAFADMEQLHFPLLADFWPHGQVSTLFGVLDETRGCPTRSSFVVDPTGAITWSVHNDRGAARDLDAHLRQLRDAS